MCERVVLPKLPYCRVMSRLYETGVISCVRHTDNSSPYEAVDRHFCNFFPPCDRDLRIVSDIDMADCNGMPPVPPAPPLPPPLPPPPPLPDVPASAIDAAELCCPGPLAPVRRTGLPVAAEAPAAVAADDGPPPTAAADDDEPMVSPASEPLPMLLRS